MGGSKSTVVRSDGGHRTKVASLIDRYDLSDIGSELERQWTAPAGERASLRTLATWFNRRLLRESLAASGEVPDDDRVRRLYERLTDRDGTGGQYTSARRALEQEGVDVDALETDFVSYQAIRSYLLTERGVDPPDRSADDPIASTSDRIRRLQGRLIAVADSDIDRLRDSGAIAVAEPTVIVDVRVICDRCGAVVEFDSMLDGVPCECAG